MIHSTTSSGKFRRLVRKLRPMLGDMPVSVELVATGLLERIWHIGISEAHRGDIGSKLDNEEIAEIIGWHGDAEELIALLVSEKWLDVHPTHRLLIHDWHIHAPRHVKGNAAKSGGFLTCDGNSLGDVPYDTKEAPLGSDTEPNLTKHNQTNRSIDRATVFSGKEIGEDEWKELQPKLKATRKAIQPDERRKLKDADRELLIAAAAIEKRAGVTLIDPILKSMKETKPQKPFPYFRTSFINACNAVGLDGRRALISIPIPRIPEAQPP